MAESITLNGLQIASGGTYALTALQLPIPVKRPEWVEGADADGALLLRDPLVGNGQMVITVDIFTASKDAAGVAIGAIVDQLEEADRTPAGIPVVWTPANGTKTMTFYALSGEVTGFDQDVKWVDGHVPTITVTLTCRPGGYGNLVTGPSQTTTGPVVSLEVPSVAGDMPTDEAYLVITDTSSQSRRHVEWGMEWLQYNPSASWPLILDSDNLVTTGFSGTGSTQSGAYDPGASGNNVITTGLYTSPQAVAGTGNQSHIGTFRVKARVYCGSTSSYVRVSWRVGDGAYTSNDWTSPPVANAFSEIDLGLITVPIVSAGAQQWDGRVEAYTATAGTTFKVDYVAVLPAGEGYGKARAITLSQAGNLIATDDFNSATAAAALGGRTAQLGGTWATSGSTTDFATNPMVYGSTLDVMSAKRTTTSDSGPRYAILGGSNIETTGTLITAIQTPISSTTSALGAGRIERWTNASNYLRAVIRNNASSSGTFELVKVVAGTPTVLASATIYNFLNNILPPGILITLTVNSFGEAVANLTKNGAQAIPAPLRATDSTLATGGTLATGSGGIYDQNTSASATTRYYDQFNTSSMPAPSIALYSGRTLEVTGSETRRQNTGGTAYGPPSSYRGSRFTLNPAGAAARTTRIWAKAHRNDVDTAAADQIADALKIQPFYRPRYSVVPR